MTVRITESWLQDPAPQAVCKMLVQGGFQAWFVGGCVRNALLGAPISDMDLTTDARPETVIALAEASGLHPVPTGIKHGTVTVVVNSVPVEITTFRRDVETDGRHANVEFAASIEEDAHRRDFTMNALYASPDGIVADPIGGMADLEARRVRFIDDAEDRIREDYLRILRFFRFHAWYGDVEAGLDADALAAIAANLDGIETLSRERVGAETMKLLAAPDPSPSLSAMAHCGVLAQILPGADPRAVPVLVHLEESLGIAPNPLRRLACLGASDEKERLRLSNADARRLERLRENMARGADAKELGYWLGVEEGRDALLLLHSGLGSDLPPHFASDLNAGAAAVFPVRPKDLMPAFSGAALGKRLKELEAQWIRSGFRLDRDALIGGCDESDD